MPEPCYHTQSCLGFRTGTTVVVAVFDLVELRDIVVPLRFAELTWVDRMRGFSRSDDEGATGAAEPVVRNRDRHIHDDDESENGQPVRRPRSASRARRLNEAAARSIMSMNAAPSTQQNELRPIMSSQ